MLDVRQPIGLLFAIYGLILVASGLLQPIQTVIPDHNISFNLDLVWGGLMGLFGMMMLSFAATDKKKSPPPEAPPKESGP
jgi:hypothetical protein